MSVPRIPDGDRRLKGLRGLLGYKSPAEAAKALGYPITVNRWTEIERPGRPARLELWEAEAIAAAAAVHIDLFTAPIDRLREVASDTPAD